MTTETESIIPTDGECRALVALGPAALRARSLRPRQAAFLAQLIATRDQLPQARERRRADPAHAVNAYRAAAALAKRAPVQ